VSDTDPHIHVEQKVLQAGPALRNIVVSMLGRAPDAPSVVTTGCGIQVPYAMTSVQPESVTCLACREHAYREYMRFADQFERMSALPGSPFTADQVSEGVQRVRDLASRFS
jgi:hypothetical protein